MTKDEVDKILDGLVINGPTGADLTIDRTPVGKHDDDRPSDITGSFVGTTASGTTTKTEAPTNAGTFEALSEAVNDVRLTIKEHDFVSLVDMHWGMYGELLTAARAAEDYNLPEQRFIQYMGNSQVRDALEERGISFRGLDFGDKWRSNSLTPLQLLAAKSLLDIVDTRSDTKKLQDLGVDSKTYNAWRRDPVFTNYLEKTATELMHGSQHEAMLALMDGVRSGNPKMVQLYLEFTGKYIPRMQHTGPDINVPALLTRILEIFMEEVKDPEVRARSADRLMGLGQANTITAALIDPSEPIPVPEIMPARELSPELKEMLDHGVGVNI